MMVTLATSGFDEIPLRWAQPLLRLERGEGEGARSGRASAWVSEWLVTD